MNCKHLEANPIATLYAEDLKAVMRGRFPWLGAAVILLAIGGLATAAQSKGRFNDGEYVGKPVDTNWGTVQVKATVQDSSLTDVQFMQYPYHRRRSAEISNWALPALRNEAIRAQSARVDMVSQATITADGFQQSLATALSRAAN
jgi:uncharacterized protein with FMN-binding domain